MIVIVAIEIYKWHVLVTNNIFSYKEQFFHWCYLIYGFHITHPFNYVKVFIIMDDAFSVQVLEMII